MTRVDNNVIECGAEEIRLFSVVRNEAVRLPFFLEYYRKMGIKRFFFIDNNSDDDTVGYLLKQSDVHVFETKQRFILKEYWLKDLLDEYGTGYWCIAADADEILIYPYYEKVPLWEFCCYLEKKEENAVESILVDMYSDKPLDEVDYKAGDDLFACFGYFDDYSYRRILDTRLNRINLETMKIWTYFGGTRERVFQCPKICCSKYTLFKHNLDMYLDFGMHGIAGANISSVQGVTLHFKYLNHFKEYVRTEVIREEHFVKAKEYKQYQKAMEENKIETLFYEKSHKYTGSMQMMELGFMKVPEDFQESLCQGQFL